MITIRNLKLKEYETNKITLEQLKEVLLRFHYGHVYKTRPELFIFDMKRELIITEVKGDYGSLSSVVFSVCGSPPKGEAILFINNYFHNDKEISGSMVIRSNGNISNKINKVTILRG